jgi:hypothetical protein
VGIFYNTVQLPTTSGPKTLPYTRIQLDKIIISIYSPLPACALPPEKYIRNHTRLAPVVLLRVIMQTNAAPARTAQMRDRNRGRLIYPNRSLARSLVNAASLCGIVKTSRKNLIVVNVRDPPLPLPRLRIRIRLCLCLRLYSN